MLRPSLTPATVALATGALACAPDVGVLEDLPPLDSVAVAQFDPTNPIPQLRLAPVPTRLVQNPDGSLVEEAVRPAPCEVPSLDQCIEFAGTWPTNVFPTLNFSAPLTEASLSNGLRLYAVRAGGRLERIPTQATQAPRADPPSACRSGDNGSGDPSTSEDDLTFGQEQIDAAWGPEPYDVTLIPVDGDGNPTLLEPDTDYVVVATDALEAQPSSEGGANRPVEPSALFFLLNQDMPPVLEDGTIVNPTLRNQLQAGVLEVLFPETEIFELDAQQRQQLNAAVAVSGRDLFGLYRLFDASLQALIANGELSDRTQAVMVNSWSTRVPTEVVFDPLATTFPTDIRFPFPNDQLLTTPTSSTTSGVQVALPTESLPPGTLTSLVQGLNTLDGFGITSPIVLQTSRLLDQASLEGNVFVLELDDAGVPTGNQAPVAAVSTASTADVPTPQLVLQPLVPLQPSTTYAIGVTGAVTDRAGFPVRSASTFDILKNATSLVELVQDPMSGATLERQLQCSTIADTGMLASPEVVLATAGALEQGLARPRWQVAFEALENDVTGPGLDRADLAAAFTYTTQNVTETVDLVKNVLVPNVYEGLPPMQGRVLPAVIDVQEPDGTSTVIADQLLDVGRTFCLPICQAGGVPGVSPEQCLLEGEVNPAVLEAQSCLLLRGLYGSAVGRARLHFLRSYRATVGNPFVAGTFTEETLAQPTVEYIPMWVITPRGPTPTGGWPVAVFQHGLGRFKEDALTIANTLAAAGWATVAIDLPFHGQRASDIADNASGLPCTNIDPADVACDLETGACAGGCDGARDGSGTGFITPNVFGVRDTYRQGTIDQLALLRTLQTEGGPMGALSDLDGGTVGYVGQSLGGITGGNFAAYLTPDEVEAVVLNVAGGGLTDILTNTVPSISASLYFALAAAGICELVDPLDPSAGCRDTPLFRTFLLVAQWVQEPADPLATSVGVARQLPMRPPNLGSDNVLLQISRPDPVVPNFTSEQLGAAYGFDVAGEDERYQVYDFSAFEGDNCHGFLLAPACGACFEEQLCRTFGAQVQAATFLGTGGAMAGPQVPDSLAGVIDCNDPCN